MEKKIVVLVIVFVVTMMGFDIGKVNSSTTTTVLRSLCENTDDPKLCHNVLSPTNSSEVKDYVKAVMIRSMDSLIEALNTSSKNILVMSNNNKEHIKMALEDCNDMLQSGIDELEESILLVQEITNRHAKELKSKLGAVIAYQQSCLDGFDFDDEKNNNSFRSELENVGKLIELSVDVVSEFLKLNHNNDIEVIDDDGYPSWFSDGDRRVVVDIEDHEPNAIVAKDGSGNFKTVMDAINSYPPVQKQGAAGRFVIYVKSGIYEEYITIDKHKPNILLYGDGPSNTIITGHKNVRDDHVSTMRTATFSTVASDFIAKSIGFENTAGPEGGQAVALRVQGDRSAFFNCSVKGYQDTLYVHANRQFYRNCEIYGTVDMIFGHSTTLIQKSKILLRKAGKLNVIVADGRNSPKMDTGIVIQNCQIMAAAAEAIPPPPPELNVVKSYLGRPWKAYSRAVFIENIIGDLIEAEGYIPMVDPAHHRPNTQNSYFAEFGNTGPGANVTGRAKWVKGGVISKQEAAKFTAQQWLQPTNDWLPGDTNIPYDPGFTNN